MSEHFYMGAINQATNMYEHSKIADKQNKYKCPSCEQDVIFRKGQKNQPHFSHFKPDNPCYYYDKPSESQIHKDAKLLLKSLLDKNVEMSFIRSCVCCKKNEEYEIPKIGNASSIELEYRFEYNGLKIADVAYIENGELLCIFEIFNTHYTKRENRPEPWLEIDAFKFIQSVNELQFTSLQIPCMRVEKCDDCVKNDFEYLNRKNKAINILYDWLNLGDEIYPFTWKEDGLQFGKIQKHAKSELDELEHDLIVWIRDDDYYMEGYFIQLCDNNNDVGFTREDIVMANSIIGVYYVDINWILTRTEIPNRIYYISGFDRYVRDQSEYCYNCDATIESRVKRMYSYDSDYKVTDYRVINMGCLECKCNSNTQFRHCFRCRKQELIEVMETNRFSNVICKSCDIYAYNKIFLNVPFSEKDEIKKYGATFDFLFKKWYIDSEHIKKKEILSKWSIFDRPYQNWSHPY